MQVSIREPPGCAIFGCMIFRCAILFEIASGTSYCTSQLASVEGILELGPKLGLCAYGGLRGVFSGADKSHKFGKIFAR